MNRFIKNFEKSTKGVIAEEVKLTQNLLIATKNTMKQHPLWEKLPDSHFIIAKEEMHKYIYSKLYPMYQSTTKYLLIITFFFLKNILEERIQIEG